MSTNIIEIMLESQCRTCSEMFDVNSDYKFSLKTKLCLDKTVEEILELFIPNMVKTNSIEDLICSNCMDEVQNFMNFIKKCITTEVNLQKKIYSEETEPCLTVKIELFDDEENEEILHNDSTIQQNISSNEKENLKKLGERFFKNVFSMNLPEDKKIHSKKYPLPLQRIPDLVRPIKTYSRKNKNVSTTQNETPQNQSTVSDTNLNTTKSIQQNTNFETPHVWNKLEPFNFDFYRYHEEMYYDSTRIISASVTDNKTLELIKNVLKNDMDVTTALSLSETGPKRILFLGNIAEKCLECDEFIPRGSLGNRHYRTKHPSFRLAKRYRYKAKPTDTPVKCPVCDTWHSNVRLYEKHLTEKHKDFVPYKCDKCKARFKKKVAYDRHVKNYDMYQDCNVKCCPVCKEKVSRFLFREHVDLHEKFPCDVCGRKFLTEKYRDAHCFKHQIANKGPKPSDVQKRLCPTCGVLVTGTLYTFHTHRLTHSTECNFLCDKCSKMFKTKAALRRHFRKHGERLHCPVCQLNMTPRNLKNHMMLKHSQTHTKLCHICGKGFCRGDYYKRHMRWHLGATRRHKYHSKTTVLREKPLPCKYCEKDFSSISYLRLHLLKVHRRNVERYKCPYCSVSLSSRSNMERHQKRHQNPKKFELTCKVCWRAVDDMKAHMLKHKHIKRRKCDDCGEVFLSKHMLQHHRWDRHYKPERVEEEREEVLWDGLSEFLDDQVKAFT